MGIPGLSVYVSNTEREESIFTLCGKKYSKIILSII
jgi:hypothetical protein